MDVLYGFVGGRKMAIGIVAVIGIFVLAGMGKLDVDAAMKWVSVLVVGTSGSIAIEDGLAQVGSKQKNTTRKS